MIVTGSQLVAEVLLAHGVDTVFGYPGGAALMSRAHPTLLTAIQEQPAKQELFWQQAVRAQQTW